MLKFHRQGPKGKPARRAAAAGAALFTVLWLAPHTMAAFKEGEEYHRDYVYGVPDAPSEAWTLANGARLYDN